MLKSDLWSNYICYISVNTKEFSVQYLDLLYTSFSSSVCHRLLAVEFKLDEVILLS